MGLGQRLVRRRGGLTRGLAFGVRDPEADHDGRRRSAGARNRTLMPGIAMTQLTGFATVAFWARWAPGHGADSREWLETDRRV
jgi:hypothetical protein